MSATGFPNYGRYHYGPVPLVSPSGTYAPPYPSQPYIPPQPLYTPQPAIITPRPVLNKEKYAWAPRTEPMKWPLAESLDVDQIVRRGDLQSVEFYMQQFAFANISKEDFKQFGSKGALNAFLILQLGCDYLLSQREGAPPSTAEPDQKLLEQYNANIKAASDAISAHKETIEKLKNQNKALHDDRSKLKKIIEKYRTKLHTLKKETKKPRSLKKTDTETGALHDETALRELKALKPTTENISDGELLSSENDNESAVEYEYEEEYYESDGEV